MLIGKEQDFEKYQYIDESTVWQRIRETEGEQQEKGMAVTIYGDQNQICIEVPLENEEIFLISPVTLLVILWFFF